MGPFCETGCEAAELYRLNGNERLAANAIHLQAAALVEKALEVEKSDSTDIAPEAMALFDQALGLLQQAEKRSIASSSLTMPPVSPTISATPT